jgi:hypothetical protein
MKTDCEFCMYYSYDEEDDSYYCEANLDEDDMERFLSAARDACPFWRPGDEYLLSRRQ